MSMYDDATKRVGTGLFLKLDAGEKRIRLIDHPYVSHKPGFKDGDPIRTVFSWLVWNYDESRVQVLEQGPSLFKQVAATAKAWGEEMPMKCDLVITTTGAGLETKRTIVPVPHAGTMPTTATLKSQNGGRDWPDLYKLTGGVPLERFAKGEDPDTVQPPVQDAEITDDGQLAVRTPAATPPNDINLDEIPF